MIAVTGRTGRRWSAARKERARDRAARLGGVERVALGMAERAADGAVRAANTPVGVGVLTAGLLIVGSVSDVRM